VDQWWKVLPRRSRGQTRATRGANNPPQRATGVSRALACVLNTRGCPQAFYTAPVIHPVRVHKYPWRQVNAVWMGSIPHRMCNTCKKDLECKVYWGLFDKISPAFELRNTARVRRQSCSGHSSCGSSKGATAGAASRRCTRGTARRPSPPARPCP
jgi:hypothetical protein